MITFIAPMRALLAVLLIALAAAATACGSDAEDAGPTTNGNAAPTPGPQLSAEEYFERLKAAFDRLEQAVAASANPGQITSPDQLLPAIQNATTGLEQAIQPFVADVRSLNPPDSLAEAHRNLIEALEKDSSDIAALAAEVRGATSLNEAASAFEARKTALVESRAPCEALQEAAQQQGINVVLPCRE